MSTPSPAALPSKPLAVQHLTRARQNYDTYQRLKTSGQALDWAVTILFYAALHEVVPPPRGIVRVAVHLPDVRDLLLLQGGVHALADKACQIVAVHYRGGASCAKLEA